MAVYIQRAEVYFDQPIGSYGYSERVERGRTFTSK
jgi:hypothetical protein